MTLLHSLLSNPLPQAFPCLLLLEAAWEHGSPHPPSWCSLDVEHHGFVCQADLLLCSHLQHLGETLLCSELNRLDEEPFLQGAETSATKLCHNSLSGFKPGFAAQNHQVHSFTSSTSTALHSLKQSTGKHIRDFSLSFSHVIARKQ